MATQEPNNFEWLIKLWPVGLVVAATIGGYATLQAKVISLDNVSRDTVKTLSVHDTKLAEFAIEQKYIKSSVDKIEDQTNKIFEAIQRIKR